MPALPASYFGNVNPDLLAHLPLTARRVLELGCGQGALAVAFTRRGGDGRWVGVELSADAATVARQRLHGVLQGDVEELGMPLVSEAAQAAWGDGGFDLLVCGDVLEHLRDPWRVLRELSSLAAPEASCAVCVPNVSHWSLILGQLQGRWTYADAGLLDRTHLRFFTRDSAIELLAQAGWRVTDVQPRVFQPEATEKAVQALVPAASALGLSRQALAEQVSAFQWVLRAVRKESATPRRLSVFGLSLAPRAGMADVRMSQPLRSMATLPDVQVRVAHGQIPLSAGSGPSVLVLQRQFFSEPAMWNGLQNLAKRGWILVSEMDDEPDHWPQFSQTGYRAFRGVHALTVSTSAMADRLRGFNPCVEVFENAVLECAPDGPPAKPSAQAGAPFRVFFGALNRAADWAEVSEPVIQALRALQAQGRQVQMVVVHDGAVADGIPADVPIERHPTLAYPDYQRVLASCDVALLVLRDTPFNRLKSDLKLVECAAMGTVPICSPVVYGLKPEHQSVALFATKPTEWAEALLTLARNADRRTQLAMAGWRYVRSQRMLAHQVQRRADFYRSLLQRQPELEAARLQRLSDAGLADCAEASAAT